MNLGDRSIERKIFLLILPIVLIPALVFVVLNAVGSRLAFEKVMHTEIGRDAVSFSDRFDRFLTDRTTELQRLVHNAVVDGRASTGELAALARAATAGEHAGAVLVLGEDATTTHLLETAALTAARRGAWLKEDELARWAAHLNELPAAGLLIDRRLVVPGRLKSLTLLAYLVPLDAGRAMVFLFDAEAVVDDYFDQLVYRPDFLVVYSDRSGLISTRQPIKESLVAEIEQAWHEANSLTTTHRVTLSNENLQEFFPGAGRTLLLAMSASQHMKRLQTANQMGSLWVFVQQYDMEAFLGPRDELIWLSVIIALGLVLLILFFASLVSRTLMAPLRALREQAEAITRGNLEVRASVRSRDEIGDLAAAFNTMAGRLRTSYQALEERVEENRLHAEHIHVINEVANAIIQALSLDNIFEILTLEMGRLFRFDAMWIALLDRDANDLRITHISPPGVIALFDRGRIPMSRSLHSQVVTSEQPVHAEVGPLHPGQFFETRALESEGFQAYLIAPLPGRERIIGTLSIASSEPDAYNRELVEIMTSLARAVAIAIEQADLFQRISHFADELQRKVSDRSRELELATKKLILAEKYFATGRMAGNLAHEINNPLGIIKNYITMVRQNLEASGGGRRKTDPNLQHIEIINEEVDRIARLISQLLDLHRPTEQKVAPVDINGILEETLALMGDGLTRNEIEVERDLAPDLPRPTASRDLLRQVLINLIRNAQDAMEGRGGRLLVRTSAVTEWEHGAERQVLRIRVSDTGTGIAPEHMSQIFDPFFTTKSPEQGSGLGLCVSYSIVRMYHGTIDVESKPGEGTTIIVTIPIMDRDDSEPPEPVI